MKIIYTKDLRQKELTLKNSNESNFILLHKDNWNDYSFQTMFRTVCCLNGSKVEIESIKILIENQDSSFAYLDRLMEQGWDGCFPIPNTNYISVPFYISFYEQIAGHLNTKTAINVAEILRDASYLVKIKDDERAISLIDTDLFKVSLQRERSAIQAFLDGWKIFRNEDILIENLFFNFGSALSNPLSLKLRFQSENPLPHDINVLIGSNGVGKSQVLHKIVDAWLKPQNDEISDHSFSKRPNLSQLVVISYSPFEPFPVGIRGEVNDKYAYQYFGLLGGFGRIIHPSIPQRRAVYSLLNCIKDDLTYSAIRDWSNKIKTLEKVLKTAIDFDDIAIEVRDKYFMPQISATHISGKDYLIMSLLSEDEIIHISSSDKDTIERISRMNSGVVLLKGGRVVNFSSGQKVFLYIVINVLGAIRRNSLILVDEPELYLHPNLEIAFIRMLKMILSSYNSKALIATHSSFVVRETPRDCVHVFKKTSEGIVINSPPFETFGGDIQRIASYVFDDNKLLEKPYETWIKQALEKYGSAQELINALGENINEEMIIQIHSMERESRRRGQW